jgi:hypothetical protein
MLLEAASALPPNPWLAPAIIVPAAGVVIASVIVPLLMHWSKGRRERANTLLAIRTAAYTEYFKKYELAAQQTGQDYEYFSRVTLQDEFLKLLRSDSSPEAIVSFNEAVGKFPSQIMSAHRKATEELTTLKIVGSNELLRLTSEFEVLNQRMLEMSTRWLEEMQTNFSGVSIESPVAAELTAMGKQAKLLKDKIILQMRVEIGANS